jgi:uncharacterized membrane protein
VAATAAAAAVAYPVLIYVGLTRWSVRAVSLAIASAAVVSAATRMADAPTRRRLRGVLAVPVCVVSLAVASAALDDPTFVLATPVLISGALLASFAVTLRAGSTPMIERFARLRHAELSAEEVAWCRRLTWVWCAFFVVNGVTALALAVAAPLAWWTLYTGGIAYALIGALAGVELIARKRRFQRFDAGPVDRVLARWLAQERAP